MAEAIRLSLAAEFAPLRMISLAMMWVAVAAWAMTMTGLVLALWRSFRLVTRSGARSGPIVGSHRSAPLAFLRRGA